MRGSRGTDLCTIPFKQIKKYSGPALLFRATTRSGEKAKKWSGDGDGVRCDKENGGHRGSANSRSRRSIATIIVACTEGVSVINVGISCDRQSAASGT
jgi:hypothetical protein